MEDSFGVLGSLDNQLKQGSLSLGLKKHTKPNEKVHFETESYMDQETNRKEDGTIIGLGYAVNAPMTRNNEPMSFLYYQGNVNGLTRRNNGNLQNPNKAIDKPRAKDITTKQYEELLKNQEKRDQELNEILNPVAKGVLENTSIVNKLIINEGNIGRMINPRTNKKYENQIIQGKLNEIDRKINTNRKIKDIKYILIGIIKQNFVKTTSVKFQISQLKIPHIFL